MFRFQTLRPKMGRKCNINGNLFYSLGLLLVIAVLYEYCTPAPEVSPVARRKSPSPPQLRRHKLKFVSYNSCEWEQLWLDHVQEWVPNGDTKTDELCLIVTVDQARYVHDFLKLTCTTRFPPPFEDWCSFEDYFKTLYYNTTESTFIQVSFTPPQGLIEFLQQQEPIYPQPIIPTVHDEHILSKFVFQDTLTGEEFVEYIEPLVFHLRSPLAGCIPGGRIEGMGDGYDLTKSWIVPLYRQILAHQRGNTYHDKFLYFDAGASSWSKGAGGPSLEYFANMWSRYDIDFDAIYAFEATTTPQDFYTTVPESWKNRTVYQQGYVSSQLADDTNSTPFLPRFIQYHSTVDDYVLFKLDIDSPLVEQGSIDYILQSDNGDAHLWIDELFWEHHIEGNPFLRASWDSWDLNQTLRESYEYFLRMRKLGIRAHSWV